MTKRAGPRYAIIPADAVTSERLAGPDLKVLALLGRHIDRRGWCVRSQGRMAEELRIARGTLQRSLSRLVEAGFVEVSHEKRRDGGQAANRYRVVLDEEARADQLDLFGAGSPLASEAALKGGADTAAADAVRQARSAGHGEGAENEAPPASRARHPLPHPDEAPPASPGRGTHRNVPFQTSPSDSRAGPRGAGEGAHFDRSPANDLDAPFLLPDAGPEGGADRDSAQLAERLRAAAGGAINVAHPAFLTLAEPLGWIAAGCDLAADILPVIAGIAARHTGPPVQSWRYFARAVTEARDRRLAARADNCQPRSAAPSCNIVPFDPRGFHEPDRDPFRPAPGRFAKHAARRRRQFAGKPHRGEDDTA